MNKPIKFCLILTLTLCTLLLSGCGEKDKFDKDHAEVIKLMEQAKAVQTKDLKIRDNDDLTANQDPRHSSIMAWAVCVFFFSLCNNSFVFLKSFFKA